MWIIYKHTNKINGKSYIGQTCKEAIERWRNGKGYSKSQPVFYNAIKKYGWRNFEHTVIESNIPTQENANCKEIFYINLYRTYVGFDDCNGYNMTMGGDNCAHLGKEIYKIDMCTLEIVEKFDSINDAARCTGTNCASSIGYCCRKEKVSAKGFYWCYADEWSPTWMPKINENASPIYQLDHEFQVIKRFSTIQEAGDRGFSRGSIIQCCQRKSRSSGGFFWCYERDYKADWKPIDTDNHKNEPVYCFETGTVYKNARQAAKETGCNLSHIYRCCDKYEKHTGGKQFCWACEKQNMSFHNEVTYQKQHQFTDAEIKILQQIYPTKGMCDELLSAIPNHSKHSIVQKVHRMGLKVLFNASSKNQKYVVCIETGQVFDSINSANEFAGCSISHCLLGHNKTAGGYHWKYINEENNTK